MEQRHLKAGRAQAGVSLLLTTMALLALALLVLAWSGEQTLLQFKHLQLQQQRDAYYLEIEKQFEQLANSVLTVSALGKSPAAKGLDTQGDWQRQVVAVPCAYAKPSATTCWRMRLENQRTGAVRERRLHVPADSCAAAYWFAPAALTQLAGDLDK